MQTNTISFYVKQNLSCQRISIYGLNIYGYDPYHTVFNPIKSYVILKPYASLYILPFANTNYIPILQTFFGNCKLMNLRKTNYNLFNQVTEKISQHGQSNMSKIEIKSSRKINFECTFDEFVKIFVTISNGLLVSELSK